MQTNPYEATSDHDPLGSSSASNLFLRIPAIVCVGSVSIAVPLVAWWAIRIINSLVVSNMGLWESILMFFSLVAAVPLGFVSLQIGKFACRGRWPLEIAISALLLCGAFPLTHRLVAAIAFWRSSSILLLYGSLIGSIAIGPILIGVLLYSILRRCLFPFRNVASNKMLGEGGGPIRS